MGIRYYAYAFDNQVTERALADPHSVLSDDPLADAWGLVPGAMVSTTTFTQAVPERDLLYLDKAWEPLQEITMPSEGSTARPAYRMFEGAVTMHPLGWEAWVRALRPEEVEVVAADLEEISDAEVDARMREKAFHVRDVKEEVEYATHYLHRAQAFMAALTADSRGMVYTIG